MSELALHFETRPSEIPLVLLPAFPFDARMWSPVLRELGTDAIRVDPPGFGDSAPAHVIATRYGSHSEASLDQYADSLAAALDEIKVEKIVLAGASMGGYTTMCFAERHPERVAGIGLVGTKASADPAEIAESRLRMADAAEESIDHIAGIQLVVLAERMVSPTTRRDNEELYESIESWLEQAPAPAIAGAQRAMAARPDRLGVLKRFDVPSFVVRGTDDVICSREDHAAMAEALGVHLHEIDRAGHLAAVEAPRLMAHLLDELLERATAQSAR